MKNCSLRYGFTACLLALLGIFGVTAYAQQPSSATGTAAPPSTSSAIPAAQLFQSAQLVELLRSSGGEKPLILQVGSHVLYAEAHIPGAEYVGAGGQDSGLQALRARVKNLDRNRFLVIYCGCCPWTKCPNIRPAYRRLTSLGFTHVQVLYLANNFGADWMAKGYPVAKGR